MKIKAASRTMLTLLLISMLTLAFNIPSILADASTAELSDDSSTIQEADGNNPSNLTDSHEGFLSEDFNRNGSARAKENPNPYSVDEDSWNFNRINEWADFAKIDGDSAELVIGVNNWKPNSYANIAVLIGENGGELVDAVSMGGEIRAVVADIPLAVISSFVTKVRVAGLSRYIEPNMRFKVNLVPNDPGWTAQWGPRKIEADYAWNLTVGDPSVVVAVIDSGVDWDHPDLAANIWNNTDEVLDGTDTDGNGFVDDIRGWDFVDTTDAVWPGEDSTIRDNNPMDFHGHGTHVSGIVAAVTNNSIGIAGVCWNCKIMAVRAAYKGTDGNGYIENDDAAAALVYAADNGAKVTSMSWSFSSSSALIYDSVKYAYDSGVLLVAATGNDATSQKHYPAAYDEVIAVTATDQWDDPAGFTNFGEWVEVAAPGVSVYSTVWDDTYTNMSGTSMSTPHVSGTAALILSQFPSMTRDRLRLQLSYTADDLGDPGFDDYYGYGRINARKAVEQAPPDHDLLILDLERPLYVELEKLATFNTTVLNFGISDETNVEVQLLANSSLVDSTSITFLPAGASTTVGLSWTPTAEGTYNVTVYAPPVPDENVTANNVKSENVLVQVLPDILIVDDNDGSGHEERGTSLPEFESALTDAGYDYVVWNESSMGNPPLIFLTKFKLVIWTCGDYWDWAVDPVDAGTLESYLAHGGNIILEGESIGYNHRPADDFMVNVAHATYQNYSTPVPGLTVTDPNHPVTLSLPTNFTWLNGEPPTWTDGASPTNGGAEVIQYTGTTTTAVTVFDGAGVGSVVYYALPLYCLNQTEKDKLVINSVNWLLVLRDILIVDDNDGSGHEERGTSLPEFESALTDAGYDYVVWNESSKGNPPLTFLTKFKLVIWTCGDYYNWAVDSTDAATLESYFGQGGNILLEGEDIGWNHQEDSFMTNVAHAIFDVDNSEALGLTVTAPTHPVTQDLPIGFTWLTDPPYDDGVNTTNGGFEVIRYTDTSWTAVTVFNGTGTGNGSVVYFAFPIYSLAQPERDTLVINSVRWLLGHDVAITNVTPSKTVVSHGYSLNINVTATNKGGYTEIFNVTVYANTTSIALQTVTLSSENSTTITFTWNTTGLAYGNYTISAVADTVLGETDTADNTLTNGEVMVTIPGDVNGDRIVDIFDIGYISAHWYPSPPIGPLGYHPNADINGDGTVDISDINITSAQWGQSW